MSDFHRFRLRWALLLPVVLLMLGAAPGPEGPVVETDRGPVQGLGHGSYDTFEGIPFAAAPTGRLRWRLPEPAPRWEGVRDARAPGPRCVQLPAIGPGGPTGSEDCLYLNVTAPAGGAAAGGRGRPVMVWFHGGGFFSGSGDAYRPERLAARGGVVVVTVNYRLGVFGLFGHPELGGAPGFALADQRAALRWVRANAARFGADPGNVTVFGESAGALSVCAHLTSPPLRACSTGRSCRADRARPRRRRGPSCPASARTSPSCRSGARLRTASWWRPGSAATVPAGCWTVCAGWTPTPWRPPN